MSGRYWMARRWMDHPLFRGERYTKAQAWLWLIENATWKPCRVSVDGKIITLNRGQLSFSIRYLATAWDWRRSRVDRFLKNLVAETMVDTRCSKIGTASGTAQNVITICNYDKYQRRNSTSGTGGGTMLGQQRDSSGTNKKKAKKVKKERGCMDGRPDDLFPGSGDDAFEEFWSAYPSRGDGANPKKPARERFLQKVAAGTPVEALLRGARGFAASVERRRDQEGERFNPTTAVCQAVTFLNQERYNEYGPEAEKPLTDEERAALARHREDGQAGNVVSPHTSAPGEP